jgi:hypothetical protein
LAPDIHQTAKALAPTRFANPLDWRNSCELSPRYAMAPELLLGYWVATSLFVAGADCIDQSSARQLVS